ncbi:MULTISPECIES: GNAT family N-acetyltransferase [Streptomyces]|uniref:GNAT family N-acetyltransferase n=1 Tax=Streptomyces apricus TaxID=1828112 RepID=A0A5B0BIW9_9ACTN|nr:GNAT family N-acetyltransferase [Streptomyces apricus]KAA0941192.1 GNAT family N-acetyltransferase [Streptomyces apricus]
MTSLVTQLPTMRQFSSPSDVTPGLRQALVECWIEVTNAGGAAGFHVPPIGMCQAAPAFDRIAGRLTPLTSRLVTAWLDGQVVGWLNVRRDPSEPISHWGTLHHVQTRTAVRGLGVGSALMNEARRVARDEMGLEQLHLTARAGNGLEGFYERLGWHEIGRWPAAFRLGPGNEQDQVLMVLAPL